MLKIKNPKKINALNKNTEDEVQVKALNQSSLAEFTKRPLPNEKELNDFEEYVEEETKEEEIKESLSEIYHDGKGGLVDVKKLDIKKKRGFFYWFFITVLFFIFLGGAIWAAYYFYFMSGSDPTNIEFSIEGKERAAAGEEFILTVNYKNKSNIDFNNIKIKAVYPENFIFLESYPKSEETKNDVWTIGNIKPQSNGKIEIKGKIIGLPDSNNIILGYMNYLPANFSSEFKKEASFAITVSDIGLDIAFDFNATALVNDKNEIIFKFAPLNNNYLNNLRLTVAQEENMEFLTAKGDENEKIKKIRPGVWDIEAAAGNNELPIAFKFKEKKGDSQEVKIILEQADANGKFYKFYEKNINYEVIKSDLNLILIINGSKNDQGVDFGQAVNYSIVYANKGAAELKDIVIMLAAESDLLDWASLSDKNNGIRSGNSISWSKEEIPLLENLKPGDEGIIDISVKIAQLDEIDLNKSYQIKSYAQYNINSGAENQIGNNDNRSNIIINKINSDLKFSEEARYFNEDNIAVGLGPLPPKVGETTVLKIYWTIANNLHELNNARVETVLPEYVRWNEKQRASAGNVYYDSENRKVVWDIGRLPITVYQVNAEFSISLTPSENQRNQVLVLISNSSVQAIDSETDSNITRTAKAQTTKLEDDEIAGQNDGRVE